MTDDYPPILTTRQVAQILGWDVLKVRQAAKAGNLPAYRLPGGRAFKFFRDEIVDWTQVRSTDTPGTAGGGQI